MKLFRRLLNRKPRSDLETSRDPHADTRRITAQSRSPLNKVLTRPAVGPRGPAPATKPVERVLGDANLEIADEDFNPYDTAAFDRATSWDKISHRKKR